MEAETTISTWSQVIGTASGRSATRFGSRTLLRVFVRNSLDQRAGRVPCAPVAADRTGNAVTSSG
ncbi:MAG: hypothetical protein OXT72_09135 [Gammaproteobacteria bacterium]|nr:hypothetical protein [Gammaproteobacteria bacterium]MDE0247524.1 hypothetical protein [Gammaproteobacteria bacterium]